MSQQRSGYRGAARRAIILSVFIAGLAFTGCSGAKRPPREQADLLQRRDAADDQLRADTRQIVNQALDRTKAEHDDYAAGRRSQPPVIDILIISGGGDWGAFGAGFLKGWKRIPATDPLAMPEFDVVTGVSTGALIAPFAFLQTDESIERIVQLYRNPRKDWVKQRWPLYFLPNNISFAEVPGLERELREQVTAEMVRELAERGREGRLCAVNTTNLDDAGPRVFDLCAEAQRATETGDLRRLHRIMLASAGIPGAFPYREIDGEMYVDGGVTSNIIYGGRMAEDDTLTAVWQQRYPDVPIPKSRYWVIFNNQLRTLPATVEPKWPAIVTRSLELATRSATVTAMRHLHAMAEISRLKRNADVEVRIVAIPGDWSAPVEGVFMKETMNNLADLGERMGAEPKSWRTDAP
jgi:predicted acylesterase/phospholipase RssA